MAEKSLSYLNELAKQPQAVVERAEKEYHDRISKIADAITKSEKIKIILLAGPSGSGKTTSANLIADAIKARGEDAMVISLDNYYRDHDSPNYPKCENGEHDYECPEALSLDELTATLKTIIKNDPFTIPKYDFVLGKRTESFSYGPIGRGCVIIEGLHALNPRISDSLPKESILKIFVSVSTNINHNGERIISGRKMRFVRRLVRDSIYRGATAERTLSMWEGVLAAEDIYLYPYKSTADIAFDTFHDFEPGVMKPFAIKLLSRSLAEKSPYIATVLNALTLVEEIPETAVPENSLIREFIPGGIYESLY